MKELKMEEYIDFLKKSDLGFQYPKEDSKIELIP